MPDRSRRPGRLDEDGACRQKTEPTKKTSRMTSRTRHVWRQADSETAVYTEQRRRADFGKFRSVAVPQFHKKIGGSLFFLKFYYGSTENRILFGFGYKKSETNTNRPIIWHRCRRFSDRNCVQSASPIQDAIHRHPGLPVSTHPWLATSTHITIVW